MFRETDLLPRHDVVGGLHTGVVLTLQGITNSTKSQFHHDTNWNSIFPVVCFVNYLCMYERLLTASHQVVISRPSCLCVCILQYF